MSTENTAADAVKLSPVEAIKANSRNLRGTLAEELADPNVDHLSEANKNLLKFHGSYQQEDRDARKNRAKAGVGKHYMYMVRLKMPGGKLTASQYLSLDEIADRYANGTIRLTTRQSIQFHGILKGNLKSLIAGINDALVSTLGACGDVNRNVMACPAPTGDPVRVEMQQLADELAAHLAPKTKAYHEIWLNGEKLGADEEPEQEPLYGKVYLPRKFKTALGLPNDNCVDILTQCLGFLAIVEDDRPAGYNLMVGGGQGRTHGKPETFPHLAQAVAYLTRDQVVPAAEAVVKLYRDHGNRADRKRARIKYLMADWGVEKFREILARDYLPFPLVPPKPFTITGLDLHLGWHRQANGKSFLGLSIENGRIKDEGSLRLRSGLREIVKRFQPLVRVTAQQDILLCDVNPADQGAINSLLNEYGIPRPENLSLVQKLSMACPAIPTCPLAITESERALPTVIDALEATLTDLGLADLPLSVRMTGCPNGCARPYQSDIGLVGRSGEKYMLFVGGDYIGSRLSYTLEDLVPKDQIVPKLTKALSAYKAERLSAAEGFGDWCTRVGAAKVREIIGAAPPKE